MEPASDYLAYRFSNGVPNQLTQRATPYKRLVKQPWDLGVYAQDAWTHRRLTVNAGIRFDHYASYAPETHLGPATLVPTRDITFPKTQMLSFKDVVPRLGATIDLFGTQKTALKIGLNKYTQALGTQVGFMNGALDPVSSLALFVTRSWNDSFFPVGDPRRGNFVPDCDLINVLANDECGTVSDTNFGQPTRSTTSDPDTTSGWGHRPYQWEFSAVGRSGADAEGLDVRRLFPADVRQLHGRRQPRARRIGVRHVLGDGADGSAAARWRRLHDQRLQGSQSGHRDPPGRQQCATGERLWRPVAGVERHRLVGERADGLGRDRERRAEHRPHGDRQLRDPRPGAGSRACSALPIVIR